MRHDPNKFLECCQIKYLFLRRQYNFDAGEISESEYAIKYTAKNEMTGIIIENNEKQDGEKHEKQDEKHEKQDGGIMR